MALPPLYKYLDVRGATLTLENKTFKHSKPSDFNDTEDLTIQSIFPEDVESALVKLAESVVDVIVDENNKPPRNSKVALLQAIYRSNPAAADEAKEQIKSNPERLGLEVEKLRTRCQSFIKETNEFLQRYRVLCVTSDNKSERMWKEYAQNHTGIVVRVEPYTVKSKFHLFKSGRYRERRPPLYDNTIDFLLTAFFGDLEKASREMLSKIVYSKTLKYKHESEYRLAIRLPDNEEWNTLTYHPNEITELYLGASMTHANKKMFIGKAKAVNPKISIFDAFRSGDNLLSFRKR